MHVSSCMSSKVVCDREAKVYHRCLIGSDILVECRDAKYDYIHNIIVVKVRAGCACVTSRDTCACRSSCSVTVVTQSYKEPTTVN